MPRHNRRTVGPTLFALMSAVRLNAASCFCSPRLQLVPSRPAVSPPPSATTTTALLASATKSTGHPRQRTTRRRARPVWSELGATTTPGIRGISTIIGGYSRGRRRGDLRAKLGAEGASKGDDAAEARGTEAGKRALSVPLTHDQLPGESFYLLDGTSMLFRAFYGRGAGGYLAANGATEVGAVLAMGIEFAQFINEVKPRYVAMAFDVDRDTTFRRAMFSAYKAQRKPIPVDLELQIPLAKAVAEALGCRTFAMEGYEADDVMATLARWGRSAGLGVVVCSTDKDMCQLVEDRVHVMQPRSGGYAIWGDEEVEAKFGVKPKSLPDLFGLVGDAADNIPGVKGIGQKGGSRLLKNFGTLESIFAGLEGVGRMDIRGSKGLQELLSQPGVEEEAMLYRDIATLDDEVPLEGVDELHSSSFLFKGAQPEAEGVMMALGFLAPLRMIQEGLSTPAVPVEVGPIA